MGPDNLIDMTKEYLSDTRNTIKLYDLVIKQIIVISHLTSEDNFAVQGTDWSIKEFTRRLKEYERIVDDLLRVSSLVAFWGTRDHSLVLRRVLTGLTDHLDPKPGLKVWNDLRWYPVLLLLYSTGISALAAENYDNLASILLINRFWPSHSYPAKLVLAIEESDPGQDTFKNLPDHKTKKFPRSEYLFNLLQPRLDDLLSLGLHYEYYFDRFEVLRALVYADLRAKKYRFWCPVGRFAYKAAHRDIHPLKEIFDHLEPAATFLR
ncbi:unnamed protein product, partial [marine sediment metagenome]